MNRFRETESFVLVREFRLIHVVANTRFRLLRQVPEQVQRLVHTARLARMGRSHNEFTVLQLQREREWEEDKARLRVRQGLLSGLDSERQRGFSTPEQTQFRPEAGDAGREFPGAARPGGFSAAVLAPLLQRHHSPVSSVISIYLRYRSRTR